MAPEISAPEGAHRRVQPRNSLGQPKIGLVLGAGGIRGCAHAGVFSALSQAGIQIDVVVGASVGSMFGLGIAGGVPAGRIATAAREARRIHILRFYTGRLRPLERNPIGRMLLEAGGGKQFRDLPARFAVLTTDMETCLPTVLDSGPVLPAVQASIALPFIAKPVELNGRFYVDGGIVETVPVRVARDLGANYVIAIRLGFNYSAPALLRRRPWTQGWLERLGREPGVISGSLRNQLRFGCRLFAASYYPAPPNQDADIEIWPEFDGLSPNSLAGAAFSYDQGYKAALQALPGIRDALTEAARRL